MHDDGYDYDKLKKPYELQHAKKERKKLRSYLN